MVSPAAVIFYFTHFTVPARVGRSPTSTSGQPGNGHMTTSSSRRSPVTLSPGFTSGDYDTNLVTAGLGMLEIGARQLNDWRLHDPPTSFPSASQVSRSTRLCYSLLPRHLFRLPGRYTSPPVLSKDLSSEKTKVSHHYRPTWRWRGIPNVCTFCFPDAPQNPSCTAQEFVRRFCHSIAFPLSESGGCWRISGSVI